MKDGHYFDKNGTEVWVQNGKYHRLGGPAKIWKDGSQFWFQNGLNHRLDGPAIIWKNGSKVWCRYNECHRDDGPAVILQSGDKEYWLNGIQYQNEILWRIEAQRMKRN